MIFASHQFGSIEEPDWVDYVAQFDESGFEVYTTRALIDVEEEETSGLAREVKAKLNMGEALDQVRTRFFELSKVVSQLDIEQKDRLYKHCEAEVARSSSALIGQTLDEWIARA